MNRKELAARKKLELELEKKFKVGDMVYYDVFPHGVKIDGVIIRLTGKYDIHGADTSGRLGIRAVGIDAAAFKKAGIIDSIPLTDADTDSVRPRKVPAKKENTSLICEEKR